MVRITDRYDPESINRQVLELWRKTHHGNEDARVPMLYPEMKTRCIVFMGLNPSFSMKAFKTIFGEEFSEERISNLYSWKKWNDQKYDEIIKIERIAKEKYEHYFQKFEDVASSVSLSWEHVDLFFDRNTNQGEVRKDIFHKKEINPVYKRQLDLSLALIFELAPKAIVVANALGSDIINTAFQDAIQYDEEKGRYFINHQSTRVPIFFSSMLSGSGALDKYSYKRLKWHIGYILNDA